MNVPQRPQQDQQPPTPPQPGQQQQHSSHGPAAASRAHPEGQAVIELNIRYAALEFLYALFPVVVTIDGYQMPAVWGRNRYTVPPGQHHVDVHMRYVGFAVGKAASAGPAAPGPPLQLEYRPPWVVYMRGALGPPPQQAPGKVVSLLLTAVILLLVVAAVVVPPAVSG